MLVRGWYGGAGYAGASSSRHRVTVIADGAEDNGICL